MSWSDRTGSHSIVAIIPARGGSVGVPRKNLRPLAGYPLLWYTIRAASKSRMVQRVFVSTEDDEIAAYAGSTGVEVLRHPAELSGDDSPTYPVIRWDLGELLRSGTKPDVIVVLRATSPLRATSDIDTALEFLLENPMADSVVSVREAVGIHPIRLKRVLPDGMLVDAFDPEGRSPRRRQELERLFLRNGAIYAARTEVIAGGGLWGATCRAYVMPDERSVNINTEFDFMVAELLVLAKSRAPVDEAPGIQASTQEPE